MDENKYMQEYDQFRTSSLLVELCLLSNASIHKFSFETCCRMDAIKQIIINRTKESSADKR